MPERTKLATHSQKNTHLQKNTVWGMGGGNPTQPSWAAPPPDLSLTLWSQLHNHIEHAFGLAPAVATKTPTRTDTTLPRT